MSKRILALLTAACMLLSLLVPASAAVSYENDIPEYIEGVQTVYTPNEKYFVSDTPYLWAGEDNIGGDSSQPCFAPGTTNGHGRYGNLSQSMGFANYVFEQLFDVFPKFSPHCNPSELNKNVETVARYASKCRYLRGDVDGAVSEAAIADLLSKVRIGDIVVVTPKKSCNYKGRAMVVLAADANCLTVYQADYLGDCKVTEDIIPIAALAEYHCVTLLRYTEYPESAPVPPEAVGAVEVSGTEFILNESVSVRWDAVRYADSYTVRLIDGEGNTLAETVTEKNVAAFVLETAGGCSAVVIPKNVYGEGAETASEPITVHNENLVTFKNDDGTVITTQRVPYGGTAVAPNVPQKTGYQFAGWDKSLANICAPTEITATYEIKHFTVKYYDVGGETFLGSETVDYMCAAKLRTDYTIDAGFVFSGWQVSFDSDGTDYTAVNGDMSLIATQRWGNTNLPIVLTMQNTHRDAGATYYATDLAVVNNETTDYNIKIIGTLKTAEGKTLKSIVLCEMTAPAMGIQLMEDCRIVYSEKATVMEFVAVRMDGNSKTGGAASKTVSADIVDDSTWGPWSDWTTADETASHDAYETRTEYRYRNKSYMTSTSSTLDGWTKYNTTSTTSGWSAWSRSSVSAFTTDAQTRAVESRYIQPTYKTQYHYYRYYPGIWTHYSSSHPYCEELWSDVQLTTVKYQGGINTYYSSYTGSGGSHYWLVCDGTTYGGADAYKRGYISNKNFTRQVQTGGGYYEYRYNDTFYTYYFWQWGGWSNWTETSVSGDEVETRTLYRYRDQSVGGEAEDTSGSFFEVEGSLNEVETDLSGLSAVIMVYKRTNTDPTEEQLEYVGETVIGENNSYSFAFKPREMPSSDTGDFIVSLGIEGADRIVNTDVIAAELPTYQVQFMDNEGQPIEDPNATEVTNSSGETIRVQLVTEGESAVAPEPPEKEGHSFVKWSETLTGIRANKTIVAEYAPKEYSVVFIDWEMNTVAVEQMEYGTAIVYPVLEAVEGILSRTWDQQEAGVGVVTGNMIVSTVAERMTYKVQFTDSEGQPIEDPNAVEVTDADGNTVLAQLVKHGDAAILPEAAPTVEGMTFADWTGDCSHRYVTQDVTFVPAYLYSGTVSRPEMQKQETEDGVLVELTCETEGAEIYYEIHTHDPEAEVELSEVGGICTCADTVSLMETEIVENINGQDFKSHATLYTGSLLLAENQTVTFMAYAEGMNESSPVVEKAKDAVSYYSAAVSENTLRQYKTSVEGAVEVTLTNETDGFEIGTFVLGFYDERGVLLDMIPMEQSIAPGTNTVVFTDIVLTGDAVANAKRIQCKIITWMACDGVKPLADAVEFVLQ